MINVEELLYEICEDESVYNKEFDLIDSGLLDSYSFMTLFATLEDYGIVIYPTQIDREMLRTSGSIQKMVDDYFLNNKTN